MSGVIRVLVIDDSAMVREILKQGLDGDPLIQVVDTAPDPFIARDKILKCKPDVLTLDVEMPKMDGVEFLRKLMPQYPLPVVMVSSLTQKGKKITLDALEAGAVDFVSKPTANIAEGLKGMMMELRAKVKIASTANVSHWKNKKPVELRKKIEGSTALAESTDKVVVIGASTGGTEALRKIISSFPLTMPGTVVVQHMPAGFTTMFAERVDSDSAVRVKEAETGDRIMQGKVLIARGDYHLEVVRSGGLYQARCFEGEKVCGHRPSVEVLMQSAAKSVGANAVGVMLTGMGHDGADGMLAMRNAGARTIAQDEASCIVFGMPKEAYKRGGAEKLVPLNNISQTIISLLSKDT
ncbi:chemotaxis response regulator protein-glutamate methylesterase [candidate division KSB1 bacterium]